MSVSVPTFLAFDPNLGNADVPGGGTVDGADTYYSKDSEPHLRNCSYVISTTGITLAGDLTVEVSNSSRQDRARDAEKWVQYTLVNDGDAISISGITSFGIDIKNLTFRRIRLVFVQTGGTGTITAEFTVKG